MTEMNTIHGRGAGKQWTFLQSFDVLMSFEKFTSVILPTNMLTWTYVQFKALSSFIDDEIKHITVSNAMKKGREKKGRKMWKINLYKWPSHIE